MSLHAFAALLARGFGKKQDLSLNLTALDVIDLDFDAKEVSVMGTIIGLIILAAADWYLVRKTGLHIHQWVSRKYQQHQQQGKEGSK